MSEKKKVLSLRKKFYKLSDTQRKVISQSSKKTLKILNRELNKKWWKECRSFTVQNNDELITTYIIYHVPSGNIYSEVSIVHEMDKDKKTPYLAERIAISKMGGNIPFIINISKLKESDTITTTIKPYDCFKGQILNGSICNG